MIEERTVKKVRYTSFVDCKGVQWEVRTKPVYFNRKIVEYETTLFCLSRFPRVRDVIVSHEGKQARQRHDGLIARLQRADAHDEVS